MSDYDALVNSAPVVVIEFYATWCEHCRNMMPVVAELRELIDSSAHIYQLDIDKEAAAAEAAGVDGVPTFIVYRGGEPVWRHSGEIDGAVLLQKIRSFIG